MPYRDCFRFSIGLLWIVLLATPCAADRMHVRSLMEMRRDKVVVQEWDLSCGAAALTTLLRYQHGANVTEKEVALGLISRDVYISDPNLVRVRRGFSLFDLKRYVDTHGYRGSGFGNMSVADLEKRAPVLVPINIFGYNHFVLFRGTLKNRVLLADPAWGNRTMTLADFEDAWIEYPTIGRVGFIVEAQSQYSEPEQSLRPLAGDFVTLN